MYDIFVSIKDMGFLPILGAIIVVVLFIKGLSGKGGGGSNDSSSK